jgi:HEAT repeat protein
MNIYPALSISLLSQLTNRELQSNYLNHLDRTSEIASLLTQITEKDLALRIVNLGLEVDLCLGASLTSSLVPELQQIIVDQINALEIPTRLKIDLWHKTKSKAALPYLQDIFVFKHRQPNDFYGQRTLELTIAKIIDLDRDLAVALLIEALYDARFYSKAVEILTDLAPVEAIDGLAGLLSSTELHNNDIRYYTIEALIKIGTEEAITKIRDALHVYKLQWSYIDWIQGLGIVAEPAMVEHLIYLLYEPAAYTERSSNNYEAYEVDRLCREVIAALERIGGAKIFDLLHQSMYWIDATEVFNSPFATIVKALFKLDKNSLFTALEGSIQSYDLIVRKRAAMALVVSDDLMSDRNLSILLNAIDDPDLDVQITIISCITKIIDFSAPDYDLVNITPELRDRAILETKVVMLKYINHPDLEIRARFISQLSTREVNEWQLIEYIDKDPIDLATLLEQLSDPEIDVRESTVTSIIELGSLEIFPILLELANNHELVAKLIWELQESYRSGTGVKIFEEFRRNRGVTTKFLETVEKSLIEAIKNDIGYLSPNIFRLGEIGSDIAILPLQQIIKSNAYASYDEPEDAVRSLAVISTHTARMALIKALTDRPNLDYLVFGIFSKDGKLGLVPQLWLYHRQTYVDGGLAAISKIQEREGLYNPDFSDLSHPLFEPPRPRLRQFLLGNNE